MIDGEAHQTFYFTWEENYLKIQEFQPSDGSGVREYYLHYEDVVNDTIEYYDTFGMPYYRIRPKKTMPTIWYGMETYIQSFYDTVELYFNNDAAYKAFIAKIKDKAFDLALKLDDAPETFPLEEMRISEESKSSTSPSETTSEDSGSSNSSSSNSSSNSTPAAKTEVTVELRNRSEGEIDIIYKDNPKNSSKTETSISSRSSKRIRIKVGGVVYDATGKRALLTITADMDGTSQIIAQ